MTAPADPATPPEPAPSTEAPRARFSFASLARVLVLPLAAVAIFLFLSRRPSGPDTPAGAENLSRVGLVQKDAEFRPVPPDEGGAVGTVWYSPAGPELELQLRAEGLDPELRYILEIGVNGTIYALGSYPSDADGELAVDTTLTRFAEGVCVGPNWDAAQPLTGEHEIRFWVKRDGNPADGTGREHAPEFPEGAELPCRGNADGDYTYVLLENEVARFTGRPTAGGDSAVQRTT